MHQVIKVMTDDGTMFNTEKEARRYLDKTYTELLCNIASQLSNITKYQAMKVFLDENGVLFEKMIALKRELDEGVIKIKEELK